MEKDWAATHRTVFHVLFVDIDDIQLNLDRLSAIRAENLQDWINVAHGALRIILTCRADDDVADVHIRGEGDDMMNGIGDILADQ